MTVTVEMRTQVSQLYVALFGRAPDAEGLAFWTQMLANGTSMDDVGSTMFATDPARSFYPLYLTNEETVRSFYVNVLGRPGDAEGLAFWTAKLNAPGADAGKVIVEMIDVVDNYTGTNPAGILSASLFNNKVNVAQWYGETGGDVEGATAILSGVTADPASVIAAKTPSGQASTLTDGIDNIVGTASDDTISAPVVQNQNGEPTNSLETGDVISGDAGTDTLNATLIDTQGLFSAPAISATLSGVEVVNYRAQYPDADFQVNQSTIDAELHSGVQQYWDDNSRAYLQIEDVRQLPEELLFGMRQTDPGVSFGVYFDPAQLAADRGTSGDSSLTLTLIDKSPGANELANFPVNGVVFTLDGTQHTVGTVAQLGATYAEFAANLQTALQARPALADITVTLNANNTITMTDPAGATFGAVGYTWVNNVVPAGGELQWNQTVGAAVISEAPITTDVVLDAVGRTSEGGTLDIGSMAEGGVEVFDVSVDRSSWLSHMESREYFGGGDRHLETVNLTSIGANGDLAIGHAVIGETGELDGRVVSGLTDVREVINVAFTGDLRYGVSLTDDAIGRYLDVATGEVQFTYQGGIGNDNVTIVDDSDDDMLSDDGDFAMDVALGAGDDRLNLDMANVDNVVVDGGTGANVIAVSRSHGTTDDNTFEGFVNFQTYEVEGSGSTDHDFTSMTGVTTVNVATVDGADTELGDLPAAVDVVITGKNQTLAGANASNDDQDFGTIEINGADATATDTTLRVTLQNTARLDGELTVDELVIGDLPGDVNPIRTLEIVSAGQRNTANVVGSIDAALVNTFNLSGTQDLTIEIDAAANSTAIAASRASLVVDGAALTGDLDLTLEGALVTAVDSGTTSTVTLTGTAGTADLLQLAGAITTTNDTTISGFETVKFFDGARGSFDASNVTGVTLFDLDDVDDAAVADPDPDLSLVDMQGDARIQVHTENVQGSVLMFDAAAQATTNMLDLEFSGDGVAFSDFGIQSRDYREISLDLGDDAAGADEVFNFVLQMQDAEGDDELDPLALAADADLPGVYDAASAYARTVKVVGGGDQGAAGVADGVDRVDLGDLTNVLSNIDVSGYVGQVDLDITAYTDDIVDRNVTFTLNGYSTWVSESIVGGGLDGTIVTYRFTTDAVAATEDVSIDGFGAFNDAAIDLTNLSVLDVSALGVQGLADVTMADVGGDVHISSNEGLNFQIILVGVALADLSNENFQFAPV